MSLNRRFVLPLLAALALAVLAVGVSACGYASHEKDVVEGEPVELGELSFNVTFSRYLNPNDTEDSAYLVGQEPPPEGSTYFGVFFEVQNESEEPQTLPSTLTITDADDNELRRAAERKPLRARRSAAKSNPQEQIPVLDSTAAARPDRGLGGDLPAARRGLRQPAADAAHPRRRRRERRGHARPRRSGRRPALARGRRRGLRPRPARRLRRRRLRLRSAAPRPPASPSRPGRRRRTRRP